MRAGFAFVQEVYYLVILFITTHNIGFLGENVLLNLFFNKIIYSH